jgi:hypothetical protein
MTFSHPSPAMSGPHDPRLAPASAHRVLLVHMDHEAEQPFLYTLRPGVIRPCPAPGRTTGRR